MISVEFMLIFAISLGAVLFIAEGMLSYGAGIKEGIGNITSAGSAESTARAAETAYRSGIEIALPEDVRIEDRLLVDSGDKIIEVGGVFENDESEPL